MEAEQTLKQIARSACEGAEPAHDYQHVLRVASCARFLSAAEGADRTIAESAALLHELFNYPKDHPDSSRSGEVCAARAAEVLRSLDWEEKKIEQVAYCIRVHGFSTGIVPDTLEARVLQDADRLDAIGAIGIARCFATSATMKRPFYDPEDPLCARREPCDKQFAVDHFYCKLLKIPERLHTCTAKKLAERKMRFMRQFLDELAAEISVAGPA
jgi:uncharacterized protein